jgi:hypothetical protein
VFEDIVPETLMASAEKMDNAPKSATRRNFFIVFGQELEA